MRKAVTLILTVAMLLSLCCFGTAFADEPKTAAEEPATEAPAAEAPADTAEDPETEPPAEAAEEPETEAEPEAAEEIEDVFADWNKDAPALKTLIEYVDAVTDENSPDYIPVEDRIATFDMDGTLYGELFPTYLEYYMLAWRILKDESIQPDSEMLALGRELRESVIKHDFASDMPIRHAQQAARAYAGLTLAEFADFVNSVLVRDVDGFEGMTYGTAFYTPMLEVVEYLQDNDFTVYVCSGSDRAICRSLLEGMIDVPYANIIGMDVAYEATGQGDADGLDYVFKAGDEVVRTDKLIIKNLKMNKVLQIVQDIGQKPVLSFGNSSGDVSMHMYTISNNPYRSAAFMLIANDEERDYGNTEKAEKLGKEWEADGFHVISMRDDFRTIYGDDVKKTGSFRWAEELAEDRLAVNDSPAWIGEMGDQQNTDQILVVAAVGETTAMVSLHQKDAKGAWKQIMTTPGFIGKNGLGKEAEGDGKTPVGMFTFNKAFGIAKNPGCPIEYQQVTRDDYWSGDQRPGYHYNELVSIKDLPDLNTADSEHIIKYTDEYQYCLNLNYNEKGTPGLGSAIFLHCLGAYKPYTSGCVAIPVDQMRIVMQNVDPDCLVVIDSLKTLSPETWSELGLEEKEAAEPAASETIETEEALPETAEENAAEESADAAKPAEEPEPPLPEEPEMLGTLGEERPFDVDYGSSYLFTEREMDRAIGMIMEEFDKWEGCEMHKIRFAGDANSSRRNTRWLNSLVGDRRFTGCIAFLSDFHSPVEQTGSWEPDTEYSDWQWWLGCTEGGDWELVTWGY